MYFPWVGMLEQVRQADTFVHYDDVQFVRGFFNRVQIKTPSGVRWLTVPLRDLHRGQRICDVQVDEGRPWRRDQRRLLAEAYRSARFCDDMLDLHQGATDGAGGSLDQLARASLRALIAYFGLDHDTTFLDSRSLGAEGKGSARILGLCTELSASVYITGHGAKNYLEHETMEQQGVRVEYMNYQMVPYPQLHGGFTPYVSALDLVANCGPEGRKYICSGTLDWKEVIHGP